MNKYTKGIKILLTLALVIGVVYLVVRHVEYYLGEQTYDEAKEIAAVPEIEVEEIIVNEDGTVTDPYLESLLDIDLAALREVNEDVVGWFCIPDTKISYPLVQGPTNQYYLRHTWKDKANSVGAIFLEHLNSPDFTDFNTLVYGHNMRDDSMFGSLSEYKKKSYWEAHPSVYIVTDSGVRRYDIFAVHQARVNSPMYSMVIKSPKKKNEFIEYSLKNSKVDTGIVPTIDDKILTVSTCTGTGSYVSRWIVQGILTAGDPAEQTD